MFMCNFRWKLTVQKKAARATYPQYDVTTPPSKSTSGVTVTKQVTSENEDPNPDLIGPTITMIKF